jgi:putative DNA primase/helicase
MEPERTADDNDRPAINFAALKLDGLTSNLEYALAYAAVGMNIVPTGRRSVPLTKHGYLDATTDPAIIRDWWKRSPFADAAWTPTPDYVVVDLDEKGGYHGLRDFVEMEGMPADDVETPQASTPSGGRHLFCLTLGRRYKNKSKFFGMGIDTRTVKGLVVLPGAGNGRLWIKSIADTPMISAPDWVPTASVHSSFKSLSEPVEPVSEHTTRGALNLAEFYRKIINAPKGTRNDVRIFWTFIAGRLTAGGELNEASARDVLVQALRRQDWSGESCNWPKLEKELRQTFYKGMQSLCKFSDYDGEFDASPDPDPDISFEDYAAAVEWEAN